MPRSCWINHSGVTTVRSLPANRMSSPNPVVLFAVHNGLCAQRVGIYVHLSVDHIQSWWIALKPLGKVNKYWNCRTFHVTSHYLGRSGTQSCSFEYNHHRTLNKYGRILYYYQQIHSYLTNYTRQQTLIFFGTRGNISVPNRTFTAEFKYVSSFSPSPTVFLVTAKLSVKKVYIYILHSYIIHLT
jgi:hypothetical protein